MVNKNDLVSFFETIAEDGLSRRISTKWFEPSAQPGTYPIKHLG